MNSYILAGGDSNSRQTYVVKIASAQTELIHLTAEKRTHTIKQVKDLWIPLSISPRLKRIVWIEEANLLTPPAQNALLKMLEEPPVDTTFYLTCTAATSLLPTIRSRCTIVIISEPSAVTNTTVLTELKRVMALTPGDRLANIVKRDRAESLSWIGR
jgi:DNA polymerase III delta prime subunit